MASQTVEARYQVKDKDGNVVLNEENQPSWVQAAVNYDFGDNLDSAVELCGAEAVHSNYVANAKVGLQSIIRAKLKAGLSVDNIQALVDAWKPGMVIEKTQVDPAVAVKNMFAGWSAEKQAQFLADLGVPQ
jgi:hypothetical protein